MVSIKYEIVQVIQDIDRTLTRTKQNDLITNQLLDIKKLLNKLLQTKKAPD